MPAEFGTTEAGRVQQPATVEIWDPFIRLFHWTLVGLFVIAYASADELDRLHVLAGYGVIVLIGLRIAWGFVGPRHARFSSFVRRPAEVRAHLTDMVRLRAKRHLGHNPAAGAMIVALLTLIAVICATGIAMTDPAWRGAEWLEEIHEGAAALSLVLIAFHVAGVVLGSLLHGENLVAAMITGRKRA